jgi:hypothetical protein
MAECQNDLHSLYGPNCPGCNPEGYRALLKVAPEGVEEPSEQKPQESDSTERFGGYSDTY